MSSGQVRSDFCRKVFGLQKVSDFMIGSKSWWICISLSCVNWVNITAMCVVGTPPALDSGVWLPAPPLNPEMTLWTFLDLCWSLFPHLESKEKNPYFAGLKWGLIILYFRCLISGEQRRMIDHCCHCWWEGVSKDMELKSFSFFPMKNFESSRRER